MAEKQMNIDDTQEEYLDTLVKLAFQQREALEIQKLFDDFEKESFEDEALAASAYEQFQKRIAKQSKQKNNRLLAKKSPNHFANHRSCCLPCIGSGHRCAYRHCKCRIGPGQSHADAYPYR